MTKMFTSSQAILAYENSARYKRDVLSLDCLKDVPEYITDEEIRKYEIMRKIMSGEIKTPEMPIDEKNLFLWHVV